MGIFNRLFQSSLSEKEIELCLDEVECLVALPYVLPAMERLKLLSERAPSKLIGPGGRLHDRYFSLMMSITQGGADQVVSITPAWKALPNVFLTTCDFNSQSIGITADALLRSCRNKEMVVFANASMNVRERDPVRQMRLFFQLCDEPKSMMFMLLFAGSFIVRSSVINEHPEITINLNMDIFFSKLGMAAQSMGNVREFR